MSDLGKLAVLGAASVGFGLGDYGRDTMLSYDPATKRDPNVAYTATPKPLGKRAKRRLRGKAKESGRG